MSGSRFWAKNQDRRPDSENADGALAGTLTAVDRCDRCGAQAYVRVLLPSRLELLFCAHHNRQHASALANIAVEIQDETTRLACRALFTIRAIRTSDRAKRVAGAPSPSSDLRTQ